MIRCCSCKEKYDFEGNIFEVDKNTNCPILICPHCGFKHAISFMPFENKIENLKKVEKINLTTNYPLLGASRIANASRVDQSGADNGDVTGWVKTADFILATRIYGSKGAYNFAYKLKWRNVTDAGVFADVGATGEISFTADTVLVDGQALATGSKICSVQTGYTWQNGLESEGDNILPDSGTYSLADEYYTEFQWALDCNSAHDNDEYEFALYELTNGTSIGTCLASIAIGPANWISPTGHVDIDNVWGGESYTYDESLTFYAYSNVATKSWSSYLELTINAISCSKVRFYAYFNTGSQSLISLDVYYANDWHNIYAGDYTNQTWIAKAIGSTQSVTAMRAKFYNTTLSTYEMKWYEADFLGVAAGGQTQYLLSTVSIATSFISALSRGVKETLTSTANIVSSITSILSKIGILLNSTSAITTSITSSLSRGITEALTSTSAITSSITGRLTRIVDLISTSPIVTSITSALGRGIKEALTSTSNIVVSTVSNLSRGIKGVLTSTSNIAISTTSSLSRGVKETLVSASNIAISITSVLSRGITEALTSTVNGVVSTTGSLSRGVKETLTSTANITVSIIANLTILAGETIQLLSTAVITSSITSSLSRGIKETLTSVTNITSSITSNLSRGVKEALTTTVNIATSITGSLSRGIKETLISTVNMVISLSGSLSRGITEALTSTVSIAVSTVGLLSRGITQTLISTTNIVISTTSSLGRGIKETLTSTVNIATSILARLLRIRPLASVVNIVSVISGIFDMGCEAIIRPYGYSGSVFTLVNKTNPANASGKITSIELYVFNDMADVEVATFYVVSGNNLTTRDHEYIGAVTAGAKRTFKVDLNVEAGDYIGFVASNHTWIYTNVSGGDGVWNKAGDFIPCTDTTFSFVPSYIFSLYGSGGGVSLGRGIKETLTSTANIATSIIAELTKFGVKALYSMVAITTSITSSLSRGVTEALTSTSAITTSITSSLSRGIKATLISTSIIATSITSVLSRGVKIFLATTVGMTVSIVSVLSKWTTLALTSTVNIVSSITATLKAIYHWVKVSKVKTDWTKVEKGKDDWILVSKEKGDTTKVSKSKDDWTKVIKEKGDISKVEKE